MVKVIKNHAGSATILQARYLWNTVIAINWLYTSLWQTFDARKENQVF